MRFKVVFDDSIGCCTGRIDCVGYLCKLCVKLVRLQTRTEKLRNIYS